MFIPKIIKLSRDVYRIILSVDKWGITTGAVDIVRTQFGEWAVCENTDLEIGEISYNYRRYEFMKLRTAKEFAKDMAIAIIEEKPYPRKIEDKYLELEYHNVK